MVNIFLPEVSEDSLAQIMQEVTARMEYQYTLKSRKIFYDEYSAIGKLTEEYNELLDAVHERKSLSEKRGEWIDIAIVALHALASYEAGMKERAKKDSQ